MMKNGMKNFSHLDAQGNARMVDITKKQPSQRLAVAQARLLVGTKVGKAIAAGEVVKGNVFTVARIAAIQAAKRTGELIPLCHPVNLQAIEVDLTLSEDYQWVDITASVELEGRTGVEMEALTAVSVAALTVYDMCKALDKGMEIANICLVKKTGGKSGEWNRVTHS